MKLARTIRVASSSGAGALAALAGLASCLTAAAQQEQWLEYHTGDEPRGYRWLEISTNAPSNVALPKLQEGACFGRWTNAFESAGGRWFCLDRSRKSGPCDRLFFDCNGNGRLDDESPVNASRVEANMAYFDPVKIVFKGEDGPISYHVIARFYQFERERAQLMVGAGGWYEGQVTLAGKKRRARLVDNTVNGIFNDASTSPSDSDRIVIFDDKDKEKEVDRYLGKYLEVDGQLLQIEVARDGAFIKAQKAEGVQFGKVRVPEAISEFEAFGRNGHFVRKPDKGELSLPVGDYRVNTWTINRKDEKGAAWKLSGASFSKAAEFTVGVENVVELPIGEPLRAVLQAREAKSQISFDLRLLGSLGETVQLLRGKERPRGPRMQVASLTGKFSSTNTFEYG